MGWFNSSTTLKTQNQTQTINKTTGAESGAISANESTINVTDSGAFKEAVSLAKTAIAVELGELKYKKPLQYTQRAF